MQKALVSLTAFAGVLFATGSAFAFDPAFNVAGRPESQLTMPCVPHSVGCRADGYPDARYYRPALEGQGNIVYNRDDSRYYAPQTRNLAAPGRWEFLMPNGHVGIAG
jgi:hypothetical protein